MTDKNEVNIIKARSFDGGIIQIECHNCVTSTAKLAKQYANSGYPDRYMIFSSTQTESDAFGERLSEGQVSNGMFLSCIFRPSMFPSQAGLLRAMASVAMITALEEHTTKKLGIGWVSDIFCEGKKIGGVTLEGKLDNFTSYEYIIITFRMKLDKSIFPPRLVDMVKSVFENESASKELIIAKSILSKFFPLYFNLKNHAKFMDVYKSKFAMKGQRAKYIIDSKKVTCKIAGIDSSTGSLTVELKGGKPCSVSTPTQVILPKRVKF